MWSMQLYSVRMRKRRKSRTRKCESGMATNIIRPGQDSGRVIFKFSTAEYNASFCKLYLRNMYPLESKAHLHMCCKAFTIVLRALLHRTLRPLDLFVAPGTPIRPAAAAHQSRSPNAPASALASRCVVATSRGQHKP